MWVNFRPNKAESTSTSLRVPKLEPIDKTPGRMSRPNGIRRQNSTQSSIRSTKSSSSLSHLQKKVEEHFFQTNTSEWQKQEVYRSRRNRRKIQEKQQKAFTRLRTVRRMYIPAIILMLIGIVILFGATIRTLGEGTIFWTRRDVFNIIGPVILVIGIILLLVVVGLENKFSQGQVNAEYEPFIHPDFKTTSGISRQVSQDTSYVSLEERRSLYSLNDSQNRSFFLSNSQSRSEMARMVGGSPEPLNGQRYDLVAQWANAMKIEVPVYETVETRIIDSDKRSENGNPPYTDRDEEENTSSDLCYSPTTSGPSVSPAIYVECVTNDSEMNNMQ